MGVFLSGYVHFDHVDAQQTGPEEDTNEKPQEKKVLLDSEAEKTKDIVSDYDLSFFAKFLPLVLNLSHEVFYRFGSYILDIRIFNGVFS